MPTQHEVQLNALDWIAAVEEAAAACQPGDTLVVHSFAQEKLAEQALQRLKLTGQVTVVSTGKRMRVFTADGDTLTPHALAQRIYDHLLEVKERADRSTPTAFSAADDAD